MPVRVAALFCNVFPYSSARYENIFVSLCFSSDAVLAVFCSVFSPVLLAVWCPLLLVCARKMNIICDKKCLEK